MLQGHESYLYVKFFLSVAASDSFICSMFANLDYSNKNFLGVNKHFMVFAGMKILYRWQT